MPPSREPTPRDAALLRHLLALAPATPATPLIAALRHLDRPARRRLRTRTLQARYWLHRTPPTA